MPTLETLSIALPTEIAAVIRQAVEAGEYSSESEVVRDALREWTHQRNFGATCVDDLRKLWLEAVADDSEGEDPEPVLDALEQKYSALAEATGR
jgi:antitoxin ParD1/3/4